MPDIKMEQVIEAVRSLSTAEQRRLWQTLGGWLAQHDETSKTAEVDKRLMEAGLLDRIPPPITDLSPYQDRKLIEIKGKPLSETIIEERG